jgi:sialate O-acetylesterase
MNLCQSPLVWPSPLMPPTTCRFADAKLVNGEVLLSGPDVASSTRVSYCWGDAPLCMYGDAGLPVGPFEATIDR